MSRPLLTCPQTPLKVMSRLLTGDQEEEGPPLYMGLFCLKVDKSGRK